eukprot:Seg856.1 transcript_id=Seg856.1/GoldUCD/mRNA.D3Y31 product="hypothetical protein" protein_id=Seg856.1/GoldUCD/D3Y31
MKITCIITFLSLQMIKQGFCEKKTTRDLQNEPCHLRKTLVNVDQAGHKYFPLVVELHRCGGACKKAPPTERKCIAATHEMIPVKVSKISGGPKDTGIIYLRNETSCQCPCTSNAESCVSATQWWDQSQCKCRCRMETRNDAWRCQAPYQWDAEACRCKCNLKCNQRQDLDPELCSCICKQDIYKKCMRRTNRYLQPDTCKCKRLDKSIGKSTGTRDCEEFPMKWIVILIIMGAAMLLILTFDCILYGKKIGFFYRIFHCCGKAYKQRSQEIGGCKLPLTARKAEEGT